MRFILVTAALSFFAPGALALADEWGPNIVAGVDIGYNPCGDSMGNDQCLRGLGLSEEAVNFSYAMEGDYSGRSVGEFFHELGDVDFGISQYIGNTIYHMPVLLNGPIGLHQIEMTRDIKNVFRDDSSRNMLRRFPNASNTAGVNLRSHRVLADGTQRFTIMETVTDACRACPILGSAVSFLDIGPSTSGQLVRRPVGLLLSDPDSMEDMSVEVIRRRPESLQVLLNALGYDAGPMDGYPGPQTRTALMEFQVEHCLTPTGQPDAATAGKLLRATGFNTPCAGSGQPPDLSANSPLLTGWYTRNPRYCEDSPAYEIAHREMISVSQEHFMWGWEDGCKVNKTMIIDGITEFRATCSIGVEYFEYQWQWDVLSPVSFRQITGFYDDAPQAIFNRCPENQVDETIETESSETEPEYTAEDTRNWALYDDIGGDEIRQIYTQWLFAKSNAERLLQTIGAMNAIDAGTSPEVVLDYVSWVMEDVSLSRELMAALGENARVINPEHGYLYSLWLLNRARNRYQPAHIDYADMVPGGFHKLNQEGDVLYGVGLDAERVEKWAHQDGREYIFIKRNNGRMDMVFDGRNNGTYNYCNLPACHMVMDILPWVKWGASVDDRSTPEERARIFQQGLLLSNNSWFNLLESGRID